MLAEWTGKKYNERHKRMLTKNYNFGGFPMIHYAKMQTGHLQFDKVSQSKVEPHSFPSPFTPYP